MKKHELLFGLTIVSVIMTSCIAISNISTISGVPEASLQNIPKGANIIIIDVPGSSIDDLYEEVISILLSRGHRISKEDKERHYINTEGKDVGQSTLQRMTLVFTEVESKSRLKITTEWKGGTEATTMATAMSGIPIQSDWAAARWEIDRRGIAFAESVAIAKEISNEIITYE